MSGCLFLIWANPLKFIKTLIKKLLTGLTVPQQYVCVALEELTPSLSITLTTKKNSVIDVTGSHLFIGYKPLIIGLVFKREEQDHTKVMNEDLICLNFHDQTFLVDKTWNGFSTNTRCIARLLLKKITEKNAGGHTIIFYEGVDGGHSFISPIHQFIQQQREKLNKKDPNNVSLSGKLHDMVRIAYAVPRIISLITLQEGELMNMFPTDLHGHVSENFYISSLRKGGRANDQVTRTGKLVISEIDITHFNLAYSLGKNHMQKMRPIEYFDCASRVSQVFGIPLPTSALRYTELNRIESFDVGIHQIHLYEKANTKHVKEGKTLSHIHQFYAQWRIDHNIPTKMWLRNR